MFDNGTVSRPALAPCGDSSLRDAAGGLDLVAREWQRIPRLVQRDGHHARVPIELLAQDAAVQQAEVQQEVLRQQVRVEEAAQQGKAEGGVSLDRMRVERN